MWNDATRTVLFELESCETERQAFEALIRYAGAVGADLLSYHHVEPAKPGREPVAGEFTLVAHGFPDPWVQRYEASDYRRIDPITAFAAYQTRPVLWSDIPRRVRLSEDQKAYIADLYSWLSPGDGLAVPLFGPSGRHGYGGIGWRQRTDAWDAVKIRAVQSIFESFHLRICELRLATMEVSSKLSPRQLDILQAMARNTPDALISEQMDMRLDALRIEVSRLLRALGVLDRPSALLRAQALGLLEKV